MSTSESFFDKDKNKIKMVDLSDEFQQTLKEGLLTEDDKIKIRNLTPDGKPQALQHSLSIKIGSLAPTIFDGHEDISITIDADALGAAEKDHNHDNVYSKLDHEHNYAGSSIPNGPADSALKLTNPFILSILGAVTGSISIDGSQNINIETAVSHTHNYAGSSTPGGVADSAAKLQTPIKLQLAGAVVGDVTFDGSENIVVSTIANHDHNYAGSSMPGGAADRVAHSLSISYDGSDPISFDGSKDVDVQINTSAVVQGVLYQFPTVGKSNALYIDKNTGVSYAYDESTGNYYSTGFGDRVVVISGNRK